MRRREALSALAAALIPAAAWAQNAQPRISILHSGFPNRTPTHLLVAELAKLGYVDGRTANVEVLGSEGDAQRLNALVAQLAAQRPAVILALTSPAAFALKQAGVATPIVFAIVSDPVGMGLVQSLSRPGANFTGVSYSEVGLGGKRLELLLDALPGIKHVAVLWGSSLPDNASMLESVKQSAPARGVNIFQRSYKGLDDVAVAFEEAKRAGAQAAIFMTDNLMFANRSRVAELAIAHRLPTVHAFAAEVQEGCLLSYGPSNPESYIRAAALADRILRGASPSELPVEQPTKFDLAINLKTALALGITIPPTLVGRADLVIE